MVQTAAGEYDGGTRRALLGRGRLSWATLTILLRTMGHATTALTAGHRLREDEAIEVIGRGTWARTRVTSSQSYGRSADSVLATNA